jgi:hypothetical protein
VERGFFTAQVDEISCVTMCFVVPDVFQFHKDWNERGKALADALYRKSSACKNWTPIKACGTAEAAPFQNLRSFKNRFNVPRGRYPGTHFFGLKDATILRKA